VFQQVFTFEDLAKLAAQLQQVAQPSGHSPGGHGANRRCA
jgi:hypothetical protein